MFQCGPAWSGSAPSGRLRRALPAEGFSGYSGPDGTDEGTLGMIRIPGLHNVENVMAAVAGSLLRLFKGESIVEAVSQFRGLPHRIRIAGEKRAVQFYDDSKGTNVDAVVRALQTFSHRR